MKKIYVLTIMLMLGFSGCSSNSSDSPTAEAEKSTTTFSVTQTSPADGATWIDINPVITVKFNQTVDAKSITASSLNLKNPSGSIVTGSITISGDSVQFKPDVPLANKEKYTLTATSDIKDSTGRTLGHNISIVFSTAREIERNALQEKFSNIYGKDAFITMIVLRANKYIDWSSPSKLAVSTGLSTLDRSVFSEFRHPIGHVQFVYGNKGYVAGYGQTGQQSGQETELMKAGFGITAMSNIVYTDGELQNSEIVNKDIETVIKAKGADNFGWITFMVDNKAIDNIEKFLENYIENEAYKRFGFPDDPKKFEGAGCSSFVNANLWASGIDFPAIDNWTRTVWIPWGLMGYNAKKIKEIEMVEFKGPDKIIKNGKIVNLWDFLTHLFNGWAEPGEGYEFTFLDPELYYRSSSLMENYAAGKTVKKIYANDEEKTQMLENLLKPYFEKNKSNIKIGNLYGVSGVVIDLRHN